MSVPTPIVKVDVRQIVFPILAGRETENGFDRKAFLGTGFFIGRRGLALTAAHVVLNVNHDLELRVGLPTKERSMRAYGIRWGLELPGADIVVMRVNIDTNACFASTFVDLPMGTDVETTAIPASMLETDSTGKTQLLMRCVKGYVSYGRANWVAANFPLLKGMSGAPLIATIGDQQYVTGVFVGQTRGEEIEDQVQEITETEKGTTTTLIEKIARVEYHARGELLQPFADFKAEEFEGLTLAELIAQDVRV